MKPIPIVTLPCKECGATREHLPTCGKYSGDVIPLPGVEVSEGTWPNDPQTRASDVIEFVRVLSAKNGNHSLGATLNRARGHELFTWWHEAQALFEIEVEPWAKKLASAVASKIASECVRRCANDVRRAQV